MSVVRRFLVAPSLVRLIRKERGGSRISEGYFAPQAGRTSFVRIDGQHCHLVLVSNGSGGGSSEERTEVPRAHGDALLDVCAGKAVYERTTLSLGAGREAMIDRYTIPAGLDLISVAFDEEPAAEAFRPPLWFGREVSGEPAYDRHAVALEGVPSGGEAALSNAALDAVLDLIEPRFGFGRSPAPATPSSAVPTPAAQNGGAPPTQSAPPASAPAQKPPAPAQNAEPSPQSAKPATPPASAPPAAAAKDTPPETKAPARPPEPSPALAPAKEPAVKAEEKPAADASPSAKPAPQAPEQSDARIEDVIESLSQALGAAIQKPQPPAREDDLAASFERWTVRPRRN